MRRGDIWVAVLAPRSGSEEKGRRPVIVVSHDGFNSVPGWRSVVVIPVSTSRSQAARGPTAVGIDAGSGGLRHGSVALCHQVTTLSREKLSRRIGSLSRSDMELVSSGLKAALDLD